MTRSIKTLFKTSIIIENANHDGEAGNKIEVFLGAEVNGKSQADLIFWEVKSRNINATSLINIGRKTNCSEQGLLEKMAEKINNVICAYYVVENNIATVVYIDVLVGLKKDYFLNKADNMIKIEKKRNAVRVAERNFSKLYTKITRISQ